MILAISHYVVLCDGPGCRDQCGGLTDAVEAVKEAKRLYWTCDVATGRWLCPKCQEKYDLAQRQSTGERRTGSA